MNEGHQRPYTDEERAAWPYGEPPALPMGIESGFGMSKFEAWCKERKWDPKIAIDDYRMMTQWSQHLIATATQNVQGADPYNQYRSQL